MHFILWTALCYVEMGTKHFIVFCLNLSTQHHRGRVGPSPTPWLARLLTLLCVPLGTSFSSSMPIQAESGCPSLPPQAAGRSLAVWGESPVTCLHQYGWLPEEAGMDKISFCPEWCTAGEEEDPWG